MTMEDAIKAIEDRTAALRTALGAGHAEASPLRTYHQAAETYLTYATGHLQMVERNGVSLPAGWLLEDRHWLGMRGNLTVQESLIEAAAYARLEQDVWTTAGGGQQPALTDMHQRCVELLVAV